MATVVELGTFDGYGDGSTYGRYRVCIAYNSCTRSYSKPTGSVSHSGVGRTSATITGSVSNWNLGGAVTLTAGTDIAYTPSGYGNKFSGTATMFACRYDSGYTTNSVRYSGWIGASGYNTWGESSANGVGSACPATFSANKGTVTYTPDANQNYLPIRVYVRAANSNGATVGGTPLDKTYNIPISNHSTSTSSSLVYGTSTSYGSNATSGTAITGLTPNTTYYYRYRLTNTAGSTDYTGSFTTSGNAPTATGLSVSNVTRTSASVSINGTYDTNASWGSWEWKYGTSTSNYGSVQTGTGSLTGLTPNTTYYVTARFKDNWGRWSDWVSTNFTTTGNNPSISSITPDIYRNKVVLNYSASYDTNDAFSSLSVRYGTSTSYGSTSSSATFANLQPNTTYYYSMTVTGTRGRTSAAYTGSFKTTAYLPSGLNIAISDILPFTAKATVSGSGDTNASITNYTYYYRTKPIKPVYDMPIKHLGDGSSWARIFYHNNKAGTVLFSSLAECQNTQTTDKYSRMYLLDDDTYKVNGKFEFMLCYPIDAPGQYNRWRQTNAPQNEYVTRVSSGSQVTGYEAVHIDWTSNYWGGLERYQSSATTAETTWLDGSVGHGNWFYAIGSMATHGRGIPSYNSTADVTELWVRIDDATTTAVSMGTSTTANISGLAEETDYIFYMSATNIAGTNYSQSIEITTPADQAKIRRYNKGAVPVVGQSLAGTTVNFTPEFLNDYEFFRGGLLREDSLGGSIGGSIGGSSGGYGDIIGGIQGGTSSTSSDLIKAENASIWATVSSNGSGYNNVTLYITDNGSTHNVIIGEQYGRDGKLTDLDNLQIYTTSYTFSDGAGELTYVTDEEKFNQLTAGRWEKGKTYFKKDGKWVKAKKIYRKVDGVWKIGTNYDN